MCMHMGDRCVCIEIDVYANAISCVYIAKCCVYIVARVANVQGRDTCAYICEIHAIHLSRESERGRFAWEREIT